MNENLKSAIEVSEIAKDAARELCRDAWQWLGGLVARADAWLADYGDEGDL